MESLDDHESGALAGSLVIPSPPLALGKSLGLSPMQRAAASASLLSLAFGKLFLSPVISRGVQRGKAQCCPKQPHPLFAANKYLVPLGPRSGEFVSLVITGSKLPPITLAFLTASFLLASRSVEPFYFLHL